MVRTFNRPEHYMVQFFCVIVLHGYISQRDFQFLMNMMQSVENIGQFLY